MPTALHNQPQPACLRGHPPARPPACLPACLPTCLQEAAISAAIAHPNVVKLIGVCLEPPALVTGALQRCPTRLRCAPARGIPAHHTGLAAVQGEAMLPSLKPPLYRRVLLARLAGGRAAAGGRGRGARGAPGLGAAPAHGACLLASLALRLAGRCPRAPALATASSRSPCLAWQALDAARGLLALHTHSPPIIHRDFKARAAGRCAGCRAGLQVGTGAGCRAGDAAHTVDGHWCPPPPQSPNLLVDERWRCAVTDFNLSRVVHEGLSLQSTGSPINPRCAGVGRDARAG